jgi:PEP-CTERM motif
MRPKQAVLGVASAAALSALSNTAFAVPCGTTVLSNWLAPGFSCTVADKTFSGFTYNADGFNVPATSVGVTPVGNGTSNPGLLFNAGWSNTGTTTLDAVIGFTATAPASTPITDASLTVSGVLPGSTFRDVETLSNGTVLTASEANPGPITASFAPVTTLTQTEDLTVFPGGTGAIVGVSLITKNFSETPTPPSVPEPGSLALLGSMLVGFGWLGRRGRKSL